MRYSQSFLVILITGLVQATGIYGQGKGDKSRYITYADLRASSNYSFWRFRNTVPDLVFGAASKNQLSLFYFDSFDKEPLPLSFEQFKEKLVMKSQDCTEEWSKEANYFRGDLVQYQHNCYEAITDSRNSPPPGSGLWNKIPTSYFGFDYLTKIGFDYQLSGESASLQYVHFYNEANQAYVVSCRAKDVVDFLNSTNLLWYKERENNLNNLVGDVFLFDRDDRDKIIHDLLSKADSAKIKKTTHLKPDTYYEILARFDRTKMIALYLHQMGNLKLDTIPKTAIFRPTGKPPRWMLLGDALLNPSCLSFSTETEKVYYEPLKHPISHALASNRSIGNVTYQVEASFRYDQQIKMRILDSVFMKNMSSLMEVVYEGLTHSKLNLFQESNLDKPFTAEEVNRNLTASMPLAYDPWSKDGAYFTGDRVQFNDRNYESLRDNNSKIQPDADAKAWTIVNNSAILYQAGDFAGIDIVYEIVFDPRGKILRKDGVAIKFFVFDWNTGLYRPIGYVGYGQLQELTGTMPDLKRFFADVVAQRYGLFEMNENSALKAVGGMSR